MQANYMSPEERQILVEKTSKQVPWQDGQTQLFLMDAEKIRRIPKTSDDGKRTYNSYEVDCTEVTSDGDVDRTIPLSEIKAGNLLSILGEGVKNVKVTPKKTGNGFFDLKFEVI